MDEEATVEAGVVSGPFLVRRSAADPTGLGIPRAFVRSGVRRELGRWAAARRSIDVVPGELHAIVRVESLGQPATSGLDGGPPRLPMDTSARLALGVSEKATDLGDAEVWLSSLRLGPFRWVREFCSRIFGIRYVTCRVVLSLPVDAERAVVRTERTAMDLLGCEPGDHLVLTAASEGRTGPRVHSSVCQVFEVSDSVIADRRRREASVDGLDSRFRSSAQDLGLEFDLPQMFIPGDLRRSLGVDSGDSILVRREIPSLFGRSFREFGLLVLLSGLAVSQLPLPIEPGWGTSIALIGVAILLGVFFTGTSMRSRVRGRRRRRGVRPSRSSRPIGLSDTVWYAGYGSNLLPRRFRCYLEGGSVEGMVVRAEGARDSSLWLDSMTGSLPGRLHFSGSFLSWGDGVQPGAGAVLDLTGGAPSPDGSDGVRRSGAAPVQAVAYRITVEQLVDVFLQEAGIGTRDVATADIRESVQRTVVQHLEAHAARSRSSATGRSISEVSPTALAGLPGSVYTRLISLPLTTASGGVIDVHVVAPRSIQDVGMPSDAYRSVMKEGLMTVIGMSECDAELYLDSAEGRRDPEPGRAEA